MTEVTEIILKIIIIKCLRFIVRNYNKQFDMNYHKDYHNHVFALYHSKLS
jgi:lysophospholipid acyltransferase (LPLAT)-like uncharacterized protein